MPDDEETTATENSTPASSSSISPFWSSIMNRR
jgi:hypothetical protein